MTAERSIHLASRHSLASVKDILEKEPNAYQSKDEDGRYPIHHAVTTRKLDIVEFLLQLSSQSAILHDEASLSSLFIMLFIHSSNRMDGRLCILLHRLGASRLFGYCWRV